ncbi:protein lin-54 homolog [Anguilla anguilla]|uniref:protein lin-54 homolog n=1 Tax=Anguilla anguilla TaxID=7936 RepID=UPI0015B07354|nr:protein lin-54 homolog [Anguilla anguilla]XP_035247264.1 protein lin-54 homolog [Anguilla anguilla]XP_035247265.1 protein lin-54 homolog [Anguilla anguilla]XP_035247267.1 protein lin-54 homolog [Anguilla anguilla]XP_035247268.1 protein lin-54 homolog [Anguilla anguilla]
MDVVSPELNSLLPDEIMDTEAIVIEDLPPEPSMVPVQMESEEAPVPMETEVPEIISMSTAVTPTQRTQALTTSTSTDSALCSISSGTQLLLTPSSSTAFKPSTSSAAKPNSPVVSGALQKVTAPFTISANHQIILNKVAASSAVDAKSSGAQVLKQEGQKLVVTTLGKAGQPIVLTLPHTGTKVSPAQGSGDTKAQPQYKVVTIGSRTDLKPVMGVQPVSTASQLLGTSQHSTLQTQQLKTVQIAKKTQASSTGPMITKFIITKPLNSKGVSGQTSVSPVITGRVLSQSTPGTPPRTITLSETLSTTPQTISSSKIAISPLKSPSKLTVVSVASQSPSSPQKSVAVPLNVALGQQILTVQQSTPTSPAKMVSNHSAPQAMKPVQTMAVGGVGTSQFKTIFPLATPPNVQQIQVPGSRFHYVRLVTATTGSSTGQTGSPSTNSAIPTAKPMVVNTAAVRMSVPIVSAQTVKQVVPKPLTSSPQVVTTSQTQQRLIMPATPLPQIQPNLTNLPPGTVLAPAPGTGNMGYAVLPAQCFTQLQQSTFVTLASSSSFSTPTGVQSQARLPLNGLSTSDSASRPRKPCNCTKSQCLKLYCDCFANGEFCNNCNCTNCFNNLEHETERLKAIKACLDRNPEAFKPKIGKGKEGESDRRHSKGCNCKRSGCLKNYCECYEAKIMCSSICKCVGCKNFEESPERKTLMHLADAAEVRVQQQTAAKTKLSCQISDLLTRTTPAITSGGGKLPFTFVTKEVAEATCDCLLEQAKQAELANQPQATAERMILEEFGRCLMRIINSASKAKTDCSINC